MITKLNQNTPKQRKDKMKIKLKGNQLLLVIMGNNKQVRKQAKSASKPKGNFDRLFKYL
jgi:hypothetical protein